MPGNRAPAIKEVSVLSKFILFVLPPVLVAMTGCSADNHDHPDLVTGHQLFEYHCAPCHKADGSGVFLKGVPANRDTELSVWQIIHKVQDGSEEKSQMPNFSKMPEQEAAKIAIYLKQLGRK